MDHKNRVIKAIQDHYARNKPKPKRARVEREEVMVEAIQFWAKEKGISLKRYESKAIKQSVGGRTIWRNSGMQYGTPDLMGTGRGYTVAIEVKAPGRRSTLRAMQREFLIDVIAQGGFGVVADDVDVLNNWWLEYLAMKRSDQNTTQWLTNLLPLMPGGQSHEA